jgi:hypothetical protein
VTSLPVDFRHAQGCCRSGVRTRLLCAITAAVRCVVAAGLRPMLRVIEGKSSSRQAKHDGRRSAYRPVGAPHLLRRSAAPVRFAPAADDAGRAEPRLDHCSPKVASNLILYRSFDFSPSCSSLVKAPLGGCIRKRLRRPSEQRFVRRSDRDAGRRFLTLRIGSTSFGDPQAGAPRTTR